MEVEARACPLRQLQKTHGGVGVLPYLPPEQRATLPASEDVTAVTGLLFEYPIIFWTPCAPMHFLDNQRRVKWLTRLSESAP